MSHALAAALEEAEEMAAGEDALSSAVLSLSETPLQNFWLMVALLSFLARLTLSTLATELRGKNMRMPSSTQT